MNYSFSLHDDFHVMALESTPTKSGHHFQVWVRRNSSGNFRGASGWDLQAAVDAALSYLRESETAIKAAQPLPAFTLDLSVLQRRD